MSSYYTKLVYTGSLRETFDTAGCVCACVGRIGLPVSCWGWERALFASQLAALNVLPNRVHLQLTKHSLVRGVKANVIVHYPSIVIRFISRLLLASLLFLTRTGCWHSEVPAWAEKAAHVPGPDPNPVCVCALCSAGVPPELARRQCKWERLLSGHGAPQWLDWWDSF